MRRSVALVVYSRNIFNNPTILAIFQTARSLNIKVILLTKNNQEYPIPENIDDFRQFYVPSSYDNKINFFSRIKRFLNYYRILISLHLLGTTMIIAVDAQGLIGALPFRNRLSKKISFYYLSFEIQFKDELNDFPHLLSLKEKEINSCKYIDGLIIQDVYRRHLLQGENNLPESLRYYYIPVSPLPFSQNQKYENKNKKRFEDLAIPLDRIKIFTGGLLDKWSGVDLILEYISNNKDSHFWFVLHDRNGFRSSGAILEKLNNLSSQGYPVSVSKEPIYKIEDYTNYISFFDLGIGLYHSIPGHPDWGKNISELGLSSGKLNTFLMVGLPVIFSGSSALREYNKSYHFGYCLEDYSSLDTLLSQVSENDLLDKSVNAKKFYDCILDPTDSIRNLLIHG